MAYINNNNGTLEIISCSETIAQENGYTIEPENFKINKYGKLNADFYNEDFSCKTESELIIDGLIVDNKGTYYDKTTAQKIEVLDYNIDKPENVTELEPPWLYPIWDTDQWIQDLTKIKIGRITNFGYLCRVEIEKGFEYTVNGNLEKFGASEVDQANWNSTIAFNDADDYPLNEEVKNWDGEYVVIADEATNKAIAKAGKALVNLYRKKFYDFKVAMLDASIDTIEKINNIKDEDYL